MMIRVALFISLVALFYYYCKEDDSANYYRTPNEINMNEVPVEISPSLKYELMPQSTLNTDSSVYTISTRSAHFDSASGLLSSISQNY